MANPKSGIPKIQTSDRRSRRPPSPAGCRLLPPSNSNSRTLVRGCLPASHPQATTDLAERVWITWRWCGESLGWGRQRRLRRGLVVLGRRRRLQRRLGLLPPLPPRDLRVAGGAHVQLRGQG